MPAHVERIISLAPNITETLYDLGLDNKLVGISRFSDSTVESDLPIVGDFMNINYEAILSLQPDLVILEKSSDDQKARLESLGIPYLETGSLTLSEIEESIRRIGETCDARSEADELIMQIHEKMDALRNTPSHRPRTLIAFSDYSGASTVEQVYAIGLGSIHSELLNIAGGENMVRTRQPFVTLSSEAVLRLDPELIIELSTGGPANDWSSLSTVDAVGNKRIHILEGTYTTIPSPRCLMQTLADFSRIIRQNEKPE